MGTGSKDQLQTIDDSSDVPAGKSAVRILQAASGTTVSADVGQNQVGSDLKFGDITSYQTVAPGNQLVSLDTNDGQASADLPLTANTTAAISTTTIPKSPLPADIGACSGAEL